MPLNTLHVSKGPDFFQKINKGLLSAFRNDIINGDFDIWQRGLSFVNPAAFSYCADRWRVASDGTGATRTISRQSHVLGQTLVPGNPQYFMRFSQSVAGSGGTYNTFRQPIESVRSFAGKTVTVTFYARFNSAANLSVYLFQWFGSGGSPSAQVITPVINPVSVGTTFAKYQYLVNVPSISGKVLGTNNDDSLGLEFQLPVNATFDFDISHVSVVEGDATDETDPFSARHISQERLLCQRYFYKTFADQIAPANGGTTTTFADTPVQFPVVLWAGVNGGGPMWMFPVTMRSTPNIVLYGNSVGRASYNLAGTTPPTTSGTDTFDVNITLAAIGNQAVRIVNNVSTSPLWGVRLHFTAESEL